MRLDYVSLLQQATLPCVNLSSLANPATVLTCDRFGANFKHRDSVAWTLLIRASARAVSLVHAASLNCFRWNRGNRETSLQTT